VQISHRKKQVGRSSLFTIRSALMRAAQKTTFVPHLTGRLSSTYCATSKVQNTWGSPTLSRKPKVCKCKACMGSPTLLPGYQQEHNWVRLLLRWRSSVLVQQIAHLCYYLHKSFRVCCPCCWRQRSSVDGVSVRSTGAQSQAHSSSYVR